VKGVKTRIRGLNLGFDTLQAAERAGEGGDKQLVIPIVDVGAVLLRAPFSANEFEHLVDRFADLTEVEPHTRRWRVTLSSHESENRNREGAAATFL
jgi:hypothetical protein